MTGPMNDRVERAYADLNRRRESLAEAQQALADGSFTVTAKKRLFTVTVNSRGELTEIKFLSGQYRAIASAALTDMLVTAVGEARELALAHAVSTFQGLLPDLPVEQIMTGTLDLGALFDDAVLGMDDDGTEPRDARHA
jgi:DNA-binding protein YbaB